MAALFLGFDPETNAIQRLPLERHALTIAGSRMGKGACQIIPTLREWPSSTIVIDPKGEAVREFVGPKNLEKKVALNSKDVHKIASGNRTDNAVAPNGLAPVPGAVKRVGTTGGRTTNYDKAGGFSEANRDFDALNPVNVRSYTDGARVERRSNNHCS